MAQRTIHRGMGQGGGEKGSGSGIGGKPGLPGSRADESSKIAEGLLNTNPRAWTAALKALSTNAPALIFVAKEHPGEEVKRAAMGELYKLATRGKDEIPQEGLELLLTEQEDYNNIRARLLSLLVGELSDQEILNFLSAEGEVEGVDKDAMIDGLVVHGRVGTLKRIVASEEHAEFREKAEAAVGRAFREGLERELG